MQMITKDAAINDDYDKNSIFCLCYNNFAG